MSMRLQVALVAGLVAVSGCTTSGLGTGAAIAPAAAGAYGGAANGRVAARIINAMDGGLIGGSVGNGLSASDRRKALEAEYRALEYGQGGKQLPGKAVAAPARSSPPSPTGSARRIAGNIRKQCSPPGRR